MKKRKPNAQEVVAAINRHNIAALRNLLAEGADPNACVSDQYHGKIPILVCAAGIQFAEGVECLLKAGADANAVMTGGRGAEGGVTALHNAIFGTDTRSGSNTKKSTDEDRFKIVDLLLKAGSDPNAVCNREETPLYHSASAGQYEICLRLLDGGASVESWPPGTIPPLVGAAGGVPAHGVEEGRKQERVVKLLLERGAPIDGQTHDGVTALMATAIRGSERLVDIFIGFKANVNHRSRDGRTPLICAALYTQDAFEEDEHQLALRIVKRLIEAGANPSARNEEGESAYDIASRSDGLLVADYLKRVGPHY